MNTYLYQEDGVWTDQFGSRWYPGTSDMFSEEAEPVCDDCGEAKEPWEVWVCLDGGNLACDKHIAYSPKWMVEKLAAEAEEHNLFHNRFVAMRCAIGQAVIELGAKQDPQRYTGYVQPV